MPANLTPQYMAAEEKYKQAKTEDEKLQALDEMLRTIPKHKGTEKLQSDIKRKISLQKKEAEKKKGSSKKGIAYNIESHGYRQVVVIGPPNSGKSSLISKLAKCDLKIADYPYTTRIPQPAMMHYENIKIQLVDTPAISADYCEPWIAGIVRNADAVLLLADLANDDILDAIEFIEEYLGKQRVYIRKQKMDEKRDDHGILKKTFVALNKSDIPDHEIIEELIKESYEDFSTCSLSVKEEQGLSELKKHLFLLLEIIRIYSKPPGKKADMEEPTILDKGSTILDLASAIHKELAKKVKGGKIWGSKDYQDGQRIPVDYKLSDENIIELISN